MPVEKAINFQNLPSGESQEEEVEVEIEILDEEDLEQAAEEILSSFIPHDANLADFLEEEDLDRIGSDLVNHYFNDKLTRSEWEESYRKGLDLLGLKVEDRTDPWDGACGVFHPLLIEAIVRYQSQTITDMFPASGPCRTKIVGIHDTERAKQAGRVEHEINYQLTEKMTEFRDEMEFMLFRQALSGSAFKKVYFDQELQRAVSMFVPADDFVVQYGASDLRTCPRYTHVMKRTPNEVLKSQVSGFYRFVDLPDPAPEFSETQEKSDEISGERVVIEEDDRHTLLEMHVELDLPEPYNDPDGIERPYVVTIDRTSMKVLSIYRNWNEADPFMNKRVYFVHYKYISGMGFYGIGLIHLIGGLTKAATSLLRQLTDAGTLSNLPGGLKTHGMRIKGDDNPISPGEWRDVDVPGGKISENIFPMPYGEPSTVLLSLLQGIVEEGRRLGSIADLDLGQGRQDAPVGTTLALLERSLKVISAVLARNYKAFKEEIRLISEIIAFDMPPNYDYEVDGPYTRQQDFDGRVDVIPVVDPNASTMAQKVVQYQAALQLAEQAPQIYDIALLHRQMIEALNIPNPEKIVPMPDEIIPMDPVTENMRVLKQEPVKAFYYQDHEAHIQVHMAAVNDPKIKELVGQSPFASQIMGAMADHITEHVAFEYRKQIEIQLGTSLPDMESPIPQDVESELSRTVANAAQKLLQKNTAEMAAEELRRQREDPLTQIQHRELQIKEGELQHKIKKDTKDQEIEAAKAALDAQVEQERIKSNERIAGAKLGADVKTKEADRKSDEMIESMKTSAKADSEERNRKTQEKISNKQRKTE